MAPLKKYYGSTGTHTHYGRAHLGVEEEVEEGAVVDAPRAHLVHRRIVIGVFRAPWLGLGLRLWLGSGLGVRVRVRVRVRVTVMVRVRVRGRVRG